MGSTSCCAPGWLAECRTIPTRVGRTGCDSPADDMSPDHPHAGGENSAAPSSDGIDDRGPSPRGWGERPRYDDWHRRLTGPSPRGWGAQPSCWTLPNTPTDHPHAGGENAAYSAARIRATRTIPTRVGRTVTAMSNCGHYAGPSPRVWGERLSADSTSGTDCGPSPRVWGERQEL